MQNHTEKAEQVAFSAAAPADERSDALSSLQKSHAPTSLGDLILPRDDLREVIDYISGEWADQQPLQKASASGVVVPFPSKNAREQQRGMQSVHLDNLQITALGDWWEKPSAFGFDALRQVVAQTPVLNAVVMTRVRQIQRFCHINDSGEGPGFAVSHIDRGHELTSTEQESIRLLNRFIQNCGWEFNPRARRRLRRDSFGQFIAKLVRDTLTLDSAPIETELARDRSLGIDGLYAVDGATIRLCTEHGYKGDDEIFALQVVQGRISTAYGYDDLIYEPRNPQSSVLTAGYGLAEPELMVRVVTGFLNAMSYNIKGFDSNAIPKGMLHLTGNYDDRDIAAFKRYWNSMVRGVQNAWALPVMVSKDQDSKASFENFGIEYNEMYFSKWMTFLTSIICAIYGMSPAEINFDSFTAGNTSALSGSDTDEKIAVSRDSGLWPLLSYFEGVISDYVISDMSEKYVFRWTGIDQDDAGRREERARLVMSVNEMRAQERLPPLDGDFGDAPLNPSLTGIWMQLKQADQPQDFGQQPGGDEQGGDHGSEQGEDPDDEQGDGQDRDELGDQSEQEQQTPEASSSGSGGRFGGSERQQAEGDDKQPLGKGGAPGGDGLHKKTITDKNGHLATQWARTPEMRAEKRGLRTLYDTTLKNGLSGPQAPLVRITADDLSAIIERGPGVEAADGSIIVHGKELQRATGTKRGHGMLKIIWRHGQKSSKDSDVRVTKSDVLALPEVLRSAPASQNDGATRFEWQRVRFDGNIVYYAVSKFGGEQDGHVVTIYVDRAGGTRMRKSDSCLQGEGLTHLGIPDEALSVVLPSDESLVGYFIDTEEQVNSVTMTKAIGMPPVIRIALPGDPV